MIKLNTIIFMMTLAIVACSSEPKVTEFQSNADPQVELQRVDENIKLAQSQQVDVLSPKNYEAAKKSRDKAVEARADNKKQEKVLHHIAVSQAYLDKANGVANIGNQILKGPIEARKDALIAKADKHYPKETEDADKNFKKLTKQIEDNDTSNAESKRGDLEKKYRELELSSIKKEKLDGAKVTLKDAINEGAKKWTPETLAWAQSRLSDDEAIIEKNLHNNEEVNKASNDAITSANRLLKMVRVAKGSNSKNPEEFALQMEQREIAAAQTEKELKQTKTSLQATQEQLAEESARNEVLESKVWLDKEFEKIRGQFSPDEAEVYKQGDKLLLRLKGLSFANNKAEISASKFSLLAKVQKIINELDSTRIEVEGHTDSVGSKKSNEELSAKRAESVKDYLIANKNVPPEKITTKGYGDSKPITTNKTEEGRAQNRRVDVIIEPLIQ